SPRERASAGGSERRDSSAAGQISSTRRSHIRRSSRSRAGGACRARSTSAASSATRTAARRTSSGATRNELRRRRRPAEPEAGRTVNPVLQARGVSVGFGGVRAVVDVDLEVGAGQLVGLIGPNGAGKTTFIDAITGFVRSNGHVELDGRDLTRLPPHARAR